MTRMPLTAAPQTSSRLDRLSLRYTALVGRQGNGTEDRLVREYQKTKGLLHNELNSS
ncbi:hypothetical protein [Desulfoscipio sp. XC116]|uniref:hypothetical protein n=1 Tax=Desulfoscipio sp. XC116 TaxID=3144975 RepID=UPI00325C07E2